MHGSNSTRELRSGTAELSVICRPDGRCLMRLATESTTSIAQITCSQKVLLGYLNQPSQLSALVLALLCALRSPGQIFSFRSTTVLSSKSLLARLTHHLSASFALLSRYPSPMPTRLRFRGVWR